MVKDKLLVKKIQFYGFINFIHKRKIQANSPWKRNILSKDLREKTLKSEKLGKVSKESRENHASFIWKKNKRKDKEYRTENYKNICWLRINIQFNIHLNSFTLSKKGKSRKAAFKKGTLCQKTMSNDNLVREAEE